MLREFYLLHSIASTHNENMYGYLAIYYCRAIPILVSDTRFHAFSRECSEYPFMRKMITANCCKTLDFLKQQRFGKSPDYVTHEQLITILSTNISDR